MSRPVRQREQRKTIALSADMWGLPGLFRQQAINWYADARFMVVMRTVQAVKMSIATPMQTLVFTAELFLMAKPGNTNK